MPNPIENFRFDVAFSFAGPNREKVRAIAELVAARVGKERVFFDEWYEHEILGDDMDVLLQRFYHEQSLLVVADLSQEYAGRDWCQAEARAIRALRFEIDPARDETQRLRLLNSRFAAGSVPGDFKTAGYLDGVNKTTEECADLILRRFALLRERLARSQPAAPAQPPSLPTPALWPAQPQTFKHGLADRALREWPAALNLLTSNSAKRILLFKGPSGYSKSALLGAPDKYAKSMHVPTAYVDFKDSKLLNEANVLRELQLGLGPVLPGFAAQKDPERWTLRQALRGSAGAALILLDSYEYVSETKELVEWIETQLLAEAEDCERLRFIIGGQKVPDFVRARWRDLAEAVELERINDQRVWKDWVHEINPNVDEKHVEAIVLGSDGIPATISAFLKTCAQKLNRPG
jgi:hypothetical protein